jgi:glycosyl transferase family 25
MTFDDQFDCFVINLKRQPDRLQEFLARNASSEIHFRHVEGIDGAQCNIVANWTRGAVGNAMSHLELWQRCAEQSKSFAVFEDDAVVRHDLKAHLTSLAAQVDGWDIILLG